MRARSCPDDRGREAVYAAEEAAFGGTILAEPQPFAELQARADAIVRGVWWHRAGAPPTEVIAARASARASSARSTDPAVIRLAASQLDEATMAHELAHVLAGIGHGHDERFRAAHVDVIALLAGSGPAEALAAGYRAFGLVIGARMWPPPVRAEGDSFVIVP
jgi:hypothetical protein